jgi:SAM-dependent methyltransferase
VKVEVTISEDKQRIEIRFSGEPSLVIKAKLENNQFQYDPLQALWHAPVMKERIAFAAMLKNDVEQRQVSDANETTINPETATKVFEMLHQLIVGLPESFESNAGGGTAIIDYTVEKRLAVKYLIDRIAPNYYKLTLIEQEHDNANLKFELHVLPEKQHAVVMDAVKGPEMQEKYRDETAEKTLGEIFIDWASALVKIRTAYQSREEEEEVEYGEDAGVKQEAFYLLKTFIPDFEKIIQQKGSTVIQVSPKWVVTVYTYDPHNGFYEVVIVDTLNEERMLQFDVNLNPSLSEAEVTAEWMNFNYQPLYGRTETEEAIEERGGDFGIEMTRTMNAWLEDIIHQKENIEKEISRQKEQELPVSIKAFQLLNEIFPSLRDNIRQGKSEEIHVMDNQGTEHLVGFYIDYSSENIIVVEDSTKANRLLSYVVTIDAEKNTAIAEGESLHRSYAALYNPETEEEILERGASVTAAYTIALVKWLTDIKLFIKQSQNSGDLPDTQTTEKDIQDLPVKAAGFVLLNKLFPSLRRKLNVSGSYEEFSVHDDDGVIHDIAFGVKKSDGRTITVVDKVHGKTYSKTYSGFTLTVDLKKKEIEVRKGGFDPEYAKKFKPDAGWIDQGSERKNRLPLTEAFVKWLSEISRLIQTESARQSSGEPVRKKAYQLLQKLIPDVEKFLKKKDSHAHYHLSRNSRKHRTMTIGLVTRKAEGYQIRISDGVNNLLDIEFIVRVDPKTREAEVVYDDMTFVYDQHFKRLARSAKQIEQPGGHRGNELTFVFIRYLNEVIPLKERYEFETGKSSEGELLHNKFRSQIYHFLIKLFPEIKSTIGTNSGSNKIDVHFGFDEGQIRKLSCFVTEYFRNNINQVILVEDLGNKRQAYYDIRLNSDQKSAEAISEYLSDIYKRRYDQSLDAKEIERNDEVLTNVSTEGLFKWLLEKVKLFDSEGLHLRRSISGEPYPTLKEIPIPFPSGSEVSGNILLRKTTGLKFLSIATLEVESETDKEKQFTLKSYETPVDAFRAGVQKMYNYLASYSSPVNTSVQRIIRALEMYCWAQGISLTVGKEDYGLSAYDFAIGVAQWNEWDEEHPINKAPIGDVQYDIIRLRRFVLNQFEKLPEEFQQFILNKLAALDKQALPTDKSVEVIRQYLDDLIVRTDVMEEERYYPVLSFFLRVFKLFSESTLTLDAISKDEIKIFDLYTALFQEDEDDPGNKIIINGNEYNRQKVHALILERIESMPEQDQYTILLQLDEVRPTYDSFKGKFIPPSVNKKTKRIADFVRHRLKTYDSNTVEEPYMVRVLIEILRGQYSPDIDDDEIVPTEAAKRNSQIEMLLFSKEPYHSSYTPAERDFIRQYTGYYEEYEIIQPAPEIIIHYLWQVAQQHGFMGGAVLDPCCGKGDMFAFAPEDTTLIGYEAHTYAATIAKILYPDTVIMNQPFESLFFEGDRHMGNKIPETFDLVICQLPRNDFEGRYAGSGEKAWTDAWTYDEYLLRRSLDVLKPGGLIVCLVPTRFNSTTINAVKKAIAAQTSIVSIHRFAENVLASTDLIIMKKKHGRRN